MRKKKRVEVVLGGLFLAIALLDHSKTVYAKSEDTVKAAFENYIRETLKIRNRLGSWNPHRRLTDHTISDIGTVIGTYGIFKGVTYV
mgnify:FL=1